MEMERGVGGRSVTKNFDGPRKPLSFSSSKSLARVRFYHSDFFHFPDFFLPSFCIKFALYCFTHMLRRLRGRKEVLSFLSSKILLNENVANCTHENFQGEKKFNKPLAPDALHQCALHYLHYTVSELKLVNCAISRALCHKLL